MDGPLHPSWVGQRAGGRERRRLQLHFSPFHAHFGPLQPHFSRVSAHFSPLQHISALFQPTSAHFSSISALFRPQPGARCLAVAMPLGDGLHPAGAGVQDTTSPQCHPPRSLEENNYYANLNESRPQPTTGSINIKVWASIEGRGRSVINSATIRRPAPATSPAATHCGEDREGCGGLGYQTPSCSGAGQCHPGGHGPVVLDLGSQLRIKRLFETLPIAFDLVMKDDDKS